MLASLAVTALLVSTLPQTLGLSLPPLPASLPTIPPSMPSLTSITMPQLLPTNMSEVATHLPTVSSSLGDIFQCLFDNFSNPGESCFISWSSLNRCSSIAAGLQNKKINEEKEDFSSDVLCLLGLWFSVSMQFSAKKWPSHSPRGATGNYTLCEPS